jgi:hypothetical protein
VTEATETGNEIWNMECQVFLYKKFTAKQTRELVKYKLDFLAVQEIKWEKSGTE